MELEAVKVAVKEALQEELKEFYIDRETHYRQHKFIEEMISYTEQCKGVVLKTVMTTIVGGAITLMIIGFAMKYGK
jgi:hypothetical protein